MMRLIDADKVKEHILKEGFYCDTKADKEATAKEIDSLFPTVEAIPIDYILKWACEFLDPYCEAYLMAMDLIKDWKKENGRAEDNSC